MYSVMWSEHCSYKSSRVHLRRFPSEGERRPGRTGRKRRCDRRRRRPRHSRANREPQPSVSRRALPGGGDRSRRHPARRLHDGRTPIALMDPLSLAPSKSRAAAIIFDGVVAGISGYGNSVGVPTVGGQLTFAPCYAAIRSSTSSVSGCSPSTRLVLGAGDGRRQPRRAPRLAHRAAMASAASASSPRPASGSANLRNGRASRWAIPSRRNASSKPARPPFGAPRRRLPGPRRRRLGLCHLGDGGTRRRSGWTIDLSAVPLRKPACPRRDHDEREPGADARHRRAGRHRRGDGDVCPPRGAGDRDRPGGRHRKRRCRAPRRAGRAARLR